MTPPAPHRESRARGGVLLPAEGAHAAAAAPRLRDLVGAGQHLYSLALLWVSALLLSTAAAAVAPPAGQHTAALTAAAALPGDVNAARGVARMLLVKKDKTPFAQPWSALTQETAGAAALAAATYLPRIYADTPFMAQRLGTFEGTKAEKHDERVRLKAEEARIRTATLNYLPGSFSPDTRQMKALHMPTATVKRFLEVLTESDDGVLAKKLRRSTCAIVGNSGLLKRTSYGGDIDKHDIVLRMNAAPTASFEQWVGQKTTVRVINNALAKALIPKVKAWDEHMRRSVLGDTASLWLRADLKLADQLRDALRSVGDKRAVVWLERDVTYGSLALFREFYIAHVEMMMRANPGDPRTAQWQRRLKLVRSSSRTEAVVKGVKLFGKPSTGMSLVYALKDVCRAVSVYGCGTHDGAGAATDYKYYDPADESTQEAIAAEASVVGSHTHSFDLEAELQLALSRDGVAALCRYTPGASAANRHCSHKRNKGGFDLMAHFG